MKKILNLNIDRVKQFLKLTVVQTLYVYEKGHSYVYPRAHNKKSREEERVTLVVAVVTAESPTCTINRASCYMPAHMALLSKCAIAGGLNGHARLTLKCFSYYQYSILVQAGDSACFSNHCSHMLFLSPFLLETVEHCGGEPEQADTGTVLLHCYNTSSQASSYMDIHSPFTGF